MLIPTIPIQQRRSRRGAEEEEQKRIAGERENWKRIQTDLNNTVLWFLYTLYKLRVYSLMLDNALE